MSAENHPAAALRPPAGAVPDAPGVYRYLDKSGHVLYVGKAKRLSSRISSYFSDPARLHPRTLRMLREAASMDWTVCGTEGEALVLEQRWIRAEQPRFNVALRDGDGYPGIVVETDGVARMRTWRGRPGAGIPFGPYPGVDPVQMVDTLGRVFGLRSCADHVYRDAAASGRPCLLGETGRCGAPCVGRESTEAHRTRADRVVAFLSGADRSVAAKLTVEMEQHAAAREYEVAARRRDEIAALHRIVIPQAVVLSERDLDVVAVHRDDAYIGIALVRVRGGELRAVVRRYASADPGLDDADQRTQLHLALAAELGGLAGLVLTDAPDPALGDALTVMREAPVKVRRPRGGEEQRVFELAQRNAEEALTGGRHRRDLSVDDRDAALEALGEAIATGRPRRIECIDISHTQGTAATASVVVMVDGIMQPAQYRRITVPVALGGDDYASIAYAVRRRLQGAGLDELPDLLIIDGGPGQAAAAARELDAAGNPGGIRLVGLAKRLEELWVPGEPDPVVLPRESHALRVAQLVRDEAHRYALVNHRRRREREALRTRLDDIPGVGPARRRALLERFGGVDAVARAGVDDLAAVPGIGPDLARRIWSAYRPS
jgi:excinuclease ABC subunit C